MLGTKLKWNLKTLKMGHLNKITIYVNTNLYSLKKSHSLTSYPRAQYKEWGDRIGKKTPLVSKGAPALFPTVPSLVFNGNHSWVTFVTNCLQGWDSNPDFHIHVHVLHNCLGGSHYTGITHISTSIHNRKHKEPWESCGLKLKHHLS